MKYTSTRDATISCSFEEAICAGYAPDGGLFVPEKLPHVTPELLEEWSTLSYPEVAFAVLRLFVSSTEINDEELESIVNLTLQGFDDSQQVVPIQQVGGIYVAELFHGPTFCFKDLGLRALVSLLSFFASSRRQPMTLLVATTGDTGPAAVQAVSDVNNPLLSILVHYPSGQISNFQRKQLTTVRSPRVRVASFEGGGGDDMDRPIKNLLSTCTQSKNDQCLTGVNSYNIGRPLMQMVHYIWAYLRVMEKLGVPAGDPDTRVDFVLPTGAMGNLAGGYMAKKMGIPFGKFCCGVNTNDIFARTIRTGQFYKSAVMHKTLSEAINIQLPYNFERLLFYLSNSNTSSNHSAIKDWMEKVDSTGQNDLSSAWLSLLREEFSSERITDQETCDCMRSVRDRFGYATCPNTAVAFAAAQKTGLFPTSISSTNNPTVLLSTASPCKFEESVTAGLGKDGWKKYYDHEFPQRGKTLLELEEVEPILYKAEESLEKSQEAWEVQARSILAELVNSVV